MPPGYHPLDVEKEWGKLHVAILEWEKQLRSEFERWAGRQGCAGGKGRSSGPPLMLECYKCLATLRLAPFTQRLAQQARHFYRAYCMLFPRN